MRKQFLTLVLLGLMCSVGNAWADPLTATFSGDNLNIVSSDKTQGAITIKKGAKATAFSDGALTIGSSGEAFTISAKDATISQVVIHQNSNNQRFNAPSGGALGSRTSSDISSYYQQPITYTTPVVSTTISSSGSSSYVKKIVVTYTENAVKSPSFTPNKGDLLTSQSFTLSTTTEGAEIYYTLDGNDPTSSSTHYTAPFTISTLNTAIYIKAIAIKNGENSQISTSGMIYISSSPAKSTWDLSSITTDDLSSSWWNGTQNKNSIAAATDETMLNNHGFDLCNGIRIGRTGSAINASKIDLFVGQGIRNNNSNGYFKIPVEIGEKYKVTYMTNSNAKSVGFTITSGATVYEVEGESLTKTLSTTSDKGSVTLTATASTIMLTISTTNTILSKVEKVVTTPILTGARKVSEDEVTSGTISKGESVPSLSFNVSASNSSSPEKDTHYSVTYSNPSGTDGLISIPDGGASFTLNNNVIGTGTLRDTLADIGTSYIVETATYDYTYTVNKIDNSNLAITPSAGTYVGKATVTMSAEDGYTIYYTVDGSNPETNPNSTRATYSAPFDVTSTTTIKAVAYKDEEYGNVVSAAYTINAPAIPTISENGLIAAGTEVTISTSDGDATIYYTTDGTNPVESVTRESYSSALTINNPCVLKATSQVNGVYSAVATSTLSTKSVSSSSYEFSKDDSTNPTGSTSFSVPLSSTSGKQDNNTSVSMIYYPGNAWTVESTYYQGNTNPGGFSNNIPSSGAYIKLSPSEYGVVTIQGYSGGEKTYYAYDEDGNQKATGKTPASGNSYNITFDVIAGKDYYVYVSGSKIMFQKLTFEKATSISSKISPIGWNSFAISYPVDLSTLSFSDETTGTAYYASAKDAENSIITLSPCTTTVAAGKGLLINGIPGKIFTINTATSGAALNDNLLVGVTADATSVSSPYVLAGVENDKPYFQQYNGSTMNAGSAYLPSDVMSAAAGRIRFVIEDVNNATGVENINSDENVVKFIENGKLLINRDGIIYDALGRKIR